MSFHPRRKYLPFCPREQCPLHVFSLESSRLVSSFPVLAQGDPFVLFPSLSFVCPYLLSSCFIYLFIFLSFGSWAPWAVGVGYLRGGTSSHESPFSLFIVFYLSLTILLITHYISNFFFHFCYSHFFLYFKKIYILFFHSNFSLITFLTFSLFFFNFHLSSLLILLNYFFFSLYFTMSFLSLININFYLLSLSASVLPQTDNPTAAHQMLREGVFTPLQ